MSGLIIPYRGVLPRIAESVFVAATATVIGDVEIGADSGVWFAVVLRGDVSEIRVGEGTNIQDGAIVHVSSGRVGSSVRLGTYIGSGVTVGHLAVLHACAIGDDAFIGMRATVMDGAVVEDGAMVAAGALVTPGKRVKSGELWAGSPARRLRGLSPDDLGGMADSAAHYIELAREYRKAAGQDHD